jgi:hypothetical protein
MITAICWGFIIIFIVYFSFMAALLLANPDPMGIFGAITIILIGILTTIILVLTMPI